MLMCDRTVVLYILLHAFKSFLHSIPMMVEMTHIEPVADFVLMYDDKALYTFSTPVFGCPYLTRHHIDIISAYIPAEIALVRVKPGFACIHIFFFLISSIAHFMPDRGRLIIYFLCFKTDAGVQIVSGVAFRIVSHICPVCIGIFFYEDKRCPEIRIYFL